MAAWVQPAKPGMAGCVRDDAIQELGKKSHSRGVVVCQQCPVAWTGPQMALEYRPVPIHAVFRHTVSIGTGNHSWNLIGHVLQVHLHIESDSTLGINPHYNFSLSLSLSLPLSIYLYLYLSIYLSLSLSLFLSLSLSLSLQGWLANWAAVQVSQ